MSKHVFYEVEEVYEQMEHERAEGMKALDSLEAEVRAALDALTGSPVVASQSRPRAKSPRRHGSPRRFIDQSATPLPTAADHLAADLLAQELAGKPKK